MINCYNLGDSRCLHFRWLTEGWTIVNKTKSQQHYFNCTFQLGTQSVDTPYSGDNYEWVPIENDIVIIGSDGFFDNIFEQEIINFLNFYCPLISKNDKLERSIKFTLEKMSDFTETISKSPNIFTPFSLEATKNGLYHKGGKLDDITVIMALIQSSNSH